ncbi:ATP-dependent helicase HrpB [Pontibacter harenae]|uniref:ATP-dependent helicase HrpB n=1 Tax=Pontibacter harenae TaxID=2894083 RepID=UPI001E436D19|nr:ATP-dependent helicase HrpB [Pontibacter harenae]MCC9168102.1 ATP-dependent helicase HrpB [Pontibacter harenae]
MPFNPFTIDLPVREIIPAVREHLAAQNTLIVNAPPGAGKSTLLPLALLDEAWLEGQKIIMLEPRRLAAKTIAERLAQLLGEEVGQTVGYRIRFENRTSAATRIEVVTEGILTRMIHSDRSLTGVGIVIFDEFHERSIHADVAMALSREAQSTLRPDLRIMVMSATLDMPQLTSLLKAPVAQSMGRQYPIETFYTGDADDRMLPEMTAKVVQQAAQEQEGDILVFLPGEGDIRKVETILRRQLRNFQIHPLFGMLPFGKQYAAIIPDRQGRRKVVLATSIAETSLTIEGISVVVDTGFSKTSRFDAKSGLSRLETVRISKDAADQRAGRAGRLGPGTAYRMWSKTTQERMAPHRTPEILEADLSSLVLDMAQWGISDIRGLTWLNPPPRAALQYATETLHQLQALEHGRITEHGKRMHTLPCHPRIAHMLLKAEETDQVPLASDIAAILEERDPLDRNAGIDINLRVEALRRFRKEQGKRFSKIGKIARSYRQLFNVEPENGTFDDYETGVLLAHCYPERIAYARPGNNAQFQLASGKYASAGHRDDLADEPWLAIAHLHAGNEDNPGRIFLASPLNPRDLAPLVKQQESYHWDVNDGELTASMDTRIGSIVLQSKPLPAPDDKHRVPAISEAIKLEGEHLLDFNEELTQWQNRVQSLRKWRPAEGWPDVSTATLLMTNADWLKPYLFDIEHPDELMELELLPILEAKYLDEEQRARLKVLAPASISLPDGSGIELAYEPNGEQPKLEIRLQDVLAWEESPTVDEGEMKVELHLLTPELKPITTVSDLASFWKGNYRVIKRQLEVVFPEVKWEGEGS